MPIPTLGRLTQNTRHADSGEPHLYISNRFSLCSLGYRLNTSVVMTKFVSQWMECMIECVNEPCCRSINYKKTYKNEANCEMLHDVVYNTSEKDLERNFSYDYIYLIEPQKVIVLRNATHQPTHKLNL